MSAWLKKWQRLSRREQIFFSGLMAVALAYIGFFNIWRPTADEISLAKKQWISLQREESNINKAEPGRIQRQEQAHRLSEEVDKLREKLAGTEQLMTHKDEVNHLVGELARQGQGLGLTVESLKQELKVDPAGNLLLIEMLCRSSYEDLVNFLNRLEGVSPFVKIVKIKMTQPKEIAQGWAQTRLTIATPVENSPGAGASARQEPAAPAKISFERNPLTSKSRPSRANPEIKKLKISGITWREKESTAIINNEVVRVGEKVGSLMVQEILPDMVVISDGVQSQAIKLGGKSS